MDERRAPNERPRPGNRTGASVFPFAAGRRLRVPQPAPCSDTAFAWAWRTISRTSSSS